MDKKYLTKTKKFTKIIDILVIKRQYRAGFSIRDLSIYWGIPYATLYRRLKNKNKGRKNRQERVAS